MWTYYWNPQSSWVANSLTRALSLDGSASPWVVHAAATGRDMWSEQPIVWHFWDILQPIIRLMEENTFFFFFLGHKIQRNKYSGSIAASKLKGKVKCKNFSDFLVDLWWPFQPSAYKSRWASGQSIGLCLELTLFLPSGKILCFVVILL